MIRLRPHVAAAWVIAVTAVAGVLGAAAGAAWAEDGDSLDLTVAVASTSASPSSTSTATSTATSPTSAASSSSVGTTAGPTGDGEPSASGGPTTDTGGSLGGVLYVSGIAWSYAPSVNPLDGSVEMRFTVRNMYSKALNASATMEVTNVFGGLVGAPVTVPVDGLKPGEARTVTATVRGLALWTVVVAHTTFTPPPKVNGVVLSPISRDTVVWFVPWLLLLGTSAAGVWVLLRGRVGRGHTVRGPHRDEWSHE